MIKRVFKVVVLSIVVVFAVFTPYRVEASETKKITIGEKEYDTFAEAVAEVEDDQIINLNDGTFTVDSNISNGKTFYIIHGTLSMSNSIEIDNNTNVTLGHNGYLQSWVYLDKGIKVKGGSTLTIEKATCKWRLYTDGSNSTINIKDGQFEELVEANPGGTINIFGGTFLSAIDAHGGNININDGFLGVRGSGVSVSASYGGLLTINGGTFGAQVSASTRGKAIINQGIFNEQIRAPLEGVFEINGGTFKHNVYTDAGGSITGYEAGNGKITINNGTFEKDITATKKGSIIINSGAVEGEVCANDDSTLVVNGGKYANEPDAKYIPSGKKVTKNDNDEFIVEDDPSSVPSVPAATTAVINTRTVNTGTVAAAIAAAGGNSNSVTTLVLGRGVKKISKNTFRQYPNIRTLVIQTKKLKKSSVKKAFTGSNVSKAHVQISSKKINKRYVRKYKRYFTKKNAGKKIKITR